MCSHETSVSFYQLQSPMFHPHTISYCFSDFMGPHYHGFILAATVKQQLKYASWLHVHMKEHANISKRLRTLHSQYLVRFLFTVILFFWSIISIQMELGGACEL